MESSNGYRVRIADSEDIGVLQKIYCDMYEYLSNCGLPYELNKDNLEEVLKLQLKARNRVVLLLEEKAFLLQGKVDKSRIISGFLTVELHRMGRRMEGDGCNIIGHVSEIYISPEFRGGGRASALLDVAEHWSKNSGAYLMECEVLNKNEKGLKFWDKMGYWPQYQIFNKKL